MCRVSLKGVVITITYCVQGLIEGSWSLPLHTVCRVSLKAVVITITYCVQGLIEGSGYYHYILCAGSH